MLKGAVIGVILGIILLHPSAKLSPQETQALIQGLNATMAQR